MGNFLPFSSGEELVSIFQQFWSIACKTPYTIWGSSIRTSNPYAGRTSRRPASDPIPLTVPDTRFGTFCAHDLVLFVHTTMPHTMDRLTIDRILSKKHTNYLTKGHSDFADRMFHRPMHCRCDVHTITMDQTSHGRSVDMTYDEQGRASYKKHVLCAKMHRTRLLNCSFVCDIV